MLMFTASTAYAQSPKEFDADSALAAIRIQRAKALANRAAMRAYRVYVVAKSVSTEMEARDIVAKNGWTESHLRQADIVLVVVRSELEYPLREYYQSIGELEEDADQQLNIAGSNFVVYAFRIDDDLRPTVVRRVAYAAKD